MIPKIAVLSDIIFNASMLTIPAILLAGCAVTPHDEQLFARNSPVALQLTEAQFHSKLNCKEAKGSILSQEIVQERQFHEVTVFNIKVKGCGKEAAYVTRCDDEKKTLCEAHLRSNDGK